jgi:hypothetical protein
VRPVNRRGTAGLTAGFTELGLRLCFILVKLTVQFINHLCVVLVKLTAQFISPPLRRPR